MSFLEVEHKNIKHVAAHVLPGGAATAVFPRAKFGAYRRYGKRILDLTIVFLAAPMVLAVGVLVALLIVMDRHSPFYTQERIGRGGKSYRMWKFRTMVPQADKQLKAYLEQNPEAKAEWDVAQKLRHDPRITKVGKILRKTSLDELPQLWNVVKGEMSLVGPRPMMLDQRELYPGNDYEALRPGITGPWQVSVRNESSFAERAKFDSDYAQGLTFVRDIKILVATISVVVGATGY